MRIMPARLGADMKEGLDFGGMIGRARLASGMSLLGVRRPGVFERDFAVGVKAPDLGVRIPTDFTARGALLVCFLVGEDGCSSEARFCGLYIMVAEETFRR